MKREDIEALFDQFEKAVIIVDGVECWKKWEIGNCRNKTLK